MGKRRPVSLRHVRRRLSARALFFSAEPEALILPRSLSFAFCPFFVSFMCTVLPSRSLSLSLSLYSSFYKKAEIE